MINNRDFLKNMQKISSFNIVDYEKSLLLDAKKSIRVNNVKTGSFDRNETLQYLNVKHQNIVNPDAFYIETEDKIGNNILHHLGKIYVQEPSAGMPVFSLKDELYDKIVLDLCASPGGKTGQISEYVGENGFVISNEYVSKRVNVLRSNVERLGLSNVAIISNSSEKIMNKLVEKIDVAFVDAPCSGEGMFRKNPKTMVEWSNENIKSCAERQFEILQNVSPIIKNKGKIVYSTCTFNKTENEEVVKKFLLNNPYFKLCDVKDDIKRISRAGEIDIEHEDLHLEYCRRFYPQDNFGEGQFFAILQKNVEDEKNDYQIRKQQEYGFQILTKQEEKLVEEFLQKNFNLKNYKLGKIGGQLFLLPHRYISLAGLNVVTCGVCVGGIEKNRFVPHHNLYSVFGNKSKNVLNMSLSDKRLDEFICGYQIYADSYDNVKDGYVAILADGLPLGFGKAKNNIINNLYPKGLRKLSK